jgi:hypothetical protein
MFLALAALATVGRRKHGGHDGDGVKSIPEATKRDLIVPPDPVALAPGTETD